MKTIRPRVQNGPRFSLYCVPLIAVAVTCLPAARSSVNAADQIRVVRHPATDTRNSHYAGYRAPLHSTPLVELPVGAVEPRGWLRRQLVLQAEGFHGHLGEISRFLKKEGNAWLSPEGVGDHGWEEVPYWLKGYILTA